MPPPRNRPRNTRNNRNRDQKDKCSQFCLFMLAFYSMLTWWSTSCTIFFNMYTFSSYLIMVTLNEWVEAYKKCLRDRNNEETKRRFKIVISVISFALIMHTICGIIAWINASKDS